MAEIYVSTDIEADGPIPGPFSMLSVGSAAYTEDGAFIDSWSVNLETLPGASTHPDTMSWWRTQPKAWKACRQDLRAPKEAMAEYAAWLDGLPGVPVFVAYPAGVDFTWVYWYLMHFVGRSPFSFAALDMKTLAMILLRRDFHDSTKRNMPRRWFNEKLHRHVALEDAIEQGDLFINMLAEARELSR